MTLPTGGVGLTLGTKSIHWTMHLENNSNRNRAANYYVFT
jgi:hypothetical protein